MSEPKGNPMSNKSPIVDLVKALRKDKGYRQSWIANIAMAYKDNERWHKNLTGKKYLNAQDKHVIANNAAEYFLWMLCKPTSKRTKAKGVTP